MWATCRRAWESSWGLLCSSCSWHLKHPTARWKREPHPACIRDRLQTAQRDTWKLRHYLCGNPVHFSMTQLLGILDFTSRAESALCGTWRNHFAADSRCCPNILHLFVQVQMPTLRYQAIKNENQKDSLYYLCFLKTLLRRAVPMPFILREDTVIVMLNCRLQDWSSREKTTCVLGYLYFTRRTSQYHIIQRGLLLPDHILCIIQSSIY